PRRREDGGRLAVRRRHDLQAEPRSPLHAAGHRQCDGERAVRAGPRLPRLLVCAAVLGTIAGAGRPAAADEWTFRTGGHIDYYSADTKSGQGDGKQILAPFGLWYDAPRWGASVRGSYGTSQHQLDGQPNAEITGFTDTTVGGDFRFTGAATEIRPGLDLDLPTGASRLKNSQLAAVQDQDLAALQRFGQGFDVNPTITAYRSFGGWGLGAGLGYLWTGEYDPTQNVPNDDYDPGDQLTVALLGDIILAEQAHVIGRF